MKVKNLEELGIGRPSTYASTIRTLQVHLSNRFVTQCSQYEGGVINFVFEICSYIRLTAIIGYVFWVEKHVFASFMRNDIYVFMLQSRSYVRIEKRRMFPEGRGRMVCWR